MQTIAIIDVGSGNLRSAQKAFERAAKDCGIEADIPVTNDPNIVAKADRVVLPGQGAFADCLTGLNKVEGLREALDHAVIKQARPYLGICVGMQLMASRGTEHGEHKGFGWIKGDVTPLKDHPTFSDKNLKIPHMGWNNLRLTTPPHPVFANIRNGSHAYFVHSYRFYAHDMDHIIASTDYGMSVAAAVGRDNLVGFQFHPEKSQEVGLALISGFLNWTP